MTVTHILYIYFSNLQSYGKFPVGNFHSWISKFWYPIILQHWKYEGLWGKKKKRRNKRDVRMKEKEVIHSNVLISWISNFKTSICRPERETIVIRLFCYLFMLHSKMVPVIITRLNHMAIFLLACFGLFFKLWRELWNKEMGYYWEL